MNIPVIILEVDWYDNKIISGETMRTKIESSGHLLAARKAKERIRIQKRRDQKGTNSTIFWGEGANGV